MEPCDEGRGSHQGEESHLGDEEFYGPGGREWSGTGVEGVGIPRGKGGTVY